MKVSMEMREEQMGDMMGEVRSRGGGVDGMEAGGNGEVVNGYVGV